MPLTKISIYKRKVSSMWKFILAMLFSSQLMAQQFIQSKAHPVTITKDVQTWCDQHFPTPPRTQPTIYIGKLPLFPTMLGVTRPMRDGSFIIDLNVMMSPNQTERVLIHELQHVIQMFNQDLLTDGEQFIWKGQAYPFDYPYRERPWEIEAEEQVKLYCD